MSSKYLQGIPAANGYAFGNAFHFIEPDLSFEPKTISDTTSELTRLQTAIEKTKDDLALLRNKVLEEQGEDNAKIFDAHLHILEDPDLIVAVKQQIAANSICAEQAIEQETNKFIILFEQMDDDYLRERVIDIKDVKRRVLAHLLQKTLPNLSLLQTPTIVVAADLSPSDTAQMNKQFIKGFITDVGGRTSHTAIMARALEIPAIVGVKNATSTIHDGDEIVIDGMKGDIYIHPSLKTKEFYENLYKKFERKRATWRLLKDEPSITADGQKVLIGGNIASPDDVTAILQHGAEGVGLYRTEFLYMANTRFPTEDEQFHAYQTVLEKMGDKPVVIRTLDIGGDKHLEYWDLPEESNPFLGLRAIRLALKHQDIFRTQVRALLRASVYGNLKIMFPMIATLEEFNAAKTLLLEEKTKLLKENIDVSETVEIGIMVEVPSTVTMADQFAKEVDFFSIGTNDLIQYTFAADRMNENVAYLYQPYHPAILHLVKKMIDAAHAQGKWVGMCGEMASNQIAIPLLLGLGLDEFSMGPPAILRARSQVKELSKTNMQQLAAKALTMTTSKEVETLVTSATKMEVMEDN